MPMKIVSAALTAAAILIGLPQVAGAADPKWPPGPYKYVVIEQDLKDALLEFGRNINVPVKVSDEVKGKLRGDSGSGTAEEFFKRLVASHGLVWYFDGSVLHVNAASELRTEVIDLGRILPSDVVFKLSKLGIADSDHSGGERRFDIGPAALYRTRAPDTRRNGPAAGACARGHQGARISRLELLTECSEFRISHHFAAPSWRNSESKEHEQDQCFPARLMNSSFLQAVVANQ
jgi:hypothetical protein